MIKPKIIVDSPHHNAECPLWHPQQQCLYWADIPRGKLYRYNPQTNSHAQIYSGEPVGGLTLQADGALLPEEITVPKKVLVLVLFFIFKPVLKVYQNLHLGFLLISCRLDRQITSYQLPVTNYQLQTNLLSL